MGATKITPTSIRINSELLEMVKAEAEEKGRSVSKQIEQILKRYYEMKNN